MGTYRCCLLVAALVSTPLAAIAADSVPAPAYRPAPAIAVLYNWTGFYVGGHVGGGWAGSASGFLGGGQVGFNYQTGPWVLGVEGQVSATSIKDSTSADILFFPGFAIGSVRAEAKLDWISTVAARIGWAFDRSFVYGKVGAAWTHVSVDALATINSFAGGVGASVTSNKTFSGWMLGLGAEYALWGNWTAKIEYNMMDFGQDFINDDKVHVVKAGVNYRFGYGPTPMVTY